MTGLAAKVVLAVVAAIGVWLLAAPGVVGLSGGARLSHLIAGPLVAAFAVIGTSAVVRGIARLNVLTGLWLVAAPALVPHGPAWPESVLAGVAIAGLSLLPRGEPGRFGGGWMALLRAAPAGGADRSPATDPAATETPATPATATRPPAPGPSPPERPTPRTLPSPTRRQAAMDRIVVITGASAGLGRAAARAFAEDGWDVALLARGEAGLEAAAGEVRAAGRRALPIEVDVADADAVEAAAARVEAELGPIEVWVNDAMESVFAPVEQITPDEYRRVTEVNYLGYVHGTLAALRRMKPRDRGVIVQVGSALAYRSIPLQAAYCATKHAIVGFTDSLRCELIHDRSRVKVTAVHMPALNTPQFGWVRSRLPNRAQPVPPIFDPEVGARAILHVAKHPGRELLVGAPTLLSVWAQKLVPGVLDWYLGRTGYKAQQTDAARPPRPDNLDRPLDEDEDRGAHGRFDRRSSSWSPALELMLHPAASGAVLVGAFLAASAAIMRIARGARS